MASVSVQQVKKRFGETEVLHGVDITIPGGALGERAALATMTVPFLLAAIMFRYFGLQRRAWQQGGDR